MPAPDFIHAQNDRLQRWLCDRAFPLWWEVGTDRARGGFFERIDLSGRPVEAPRRARVVARQTWVFANAGRLGWTGPWREAALHGAAALTGRYSRPDGLFGILVDADGTMLDETPAPYEQAFAMLALASLQRQFSGEYEARAARCRDAVLAAGIVRPDGGVPEHGLLQANPMMHMFEAALAWTAVSDDPAWRAFADAFAGSAAERMIDPATGALREQYDPDWTRRPESDVEPGHQLEWAWLLLSHGRDEAAAHRLIGIGESRGVRDGVAIAALDRDLAVRDTSARLWAQTERIHAHAVARRWDDLPAAVDGLFRFLDDPVVGSWRDRMDAGHALIDEAAPASSLYHIVSAALALDEACTSD